MPRQSGRMWRRSVLAAQFCTGLALVTLAAGCGGASSGKASGSAPGDTASGSASAAAGTKDLGTIKMLLGEQYSLPEIGTDAALDQNLFAGTGLDVKVVLGDQGPQALATGDADVTSGSPNRIVGAILSGLDVKIVGPTITAWDQYLIVGKTSKAKTPAELKGSKFGISAFGSAGDYSATKLATSQGWSKSDYSLVTLGSLKGLIAGLKNGTIDAFAWSAGPAYTAEQQGYGRVVGSVRDFIGPSPLDVLAVSGKDIKERPDAVKAFCKGYYQAQDNLKGDPAATERLLLKGGIDKAIVGKVISSELKLIASSPEMSDELINGMAESTRATTKSGPGKTVTADQVKAMTLPCDSI